MKRQPYWERPQKKTPLHSDLERSQRTMAGWEKPQLTYLEQGCVIKGHAAMDGKPSLLCSVLIYTGLLEPYFFA